MSNTGPSSSQSTNVVPVGLDKDSGVFYAAGSPFHVITQENLSTDSASRSSISTARVIPARNRLTVVGDSRGAYGTSYSLLNGSATFNSASPMMWINDFLAMYGPGFDLVSTYAAGGETVESCISSGRFAQALADPAESVWVMLGQGNLNTTPNNDPVDTLLTLLETQIVAPLSAAKQLVLLTGFTPIYQSGSTTLAPRAYLIPALNSAIKAMASRYGNVVFMDAYNPIADTTSASLDALPNMLRTGDGVHYITQGAQRTGYAIGADISDKIKLTRWATKGANLLPAWSGTGGTQTGTFTLTGSLPAGYDLQAFSGSGTGASVTITDLAPDYKRLVFQAGSADCLFLIRPTAATSASIASQFSIGDKVMGSVVYQVRSGTDVRSVYAATRLNGNNSYQSIAGSVNTSQEPLTEVVYPSRAIGGKRVVPSLTLVAAPTAVEFLIAIQIKATTGAVTVELAAPELCKLTP